MKRINEIINAVKTVALGRKRWLSLVLLGLFLFIGSALQAQTNSFPDSTTIYTGLATPFNAALTWVIGATAVLVLIGWILRAVSRRK